MADETHPNWDGSFEGHARCPHCGELDEDTSDYPESLRRDGDETEFDCANCDKPYKVTMCVEYTFATKPLFIGPVRDYAIWYEQRRAAREAQSGTTEKGGKANG